MVFLENFYEWLLVLHLLATFVLVGSLTHNLLCVVKFIRGEFGRAKLEWRYVRVSLWSYVIVYILGTVIYPAFGAYIRGTYFDSLLPWATGLFEIKEHWGAVGLALMFVYYFLRKNFTPRQEREKLLYLYAPLCVILNVIIWYEVVVGCYLTVLRGSWS